MHNTVAYLGPGEPESSEEALELVVQAAHRQGFVAVDTETISLKDRYCIGAGAAAGEHRAYVMRGTPNWPAMLGLIEDTQLVRVFHNTMFDAEALGLDPEHLYNIADTSMMAQMQGMPAALQTIAYDACGLLIKIISDILPERKTMLDVPFPVTAAKCLDDVMATQALYKTMDGPSWHSPDSHTWKSYLWGHKTVTRGMKDCYRTDVALMPMLRRMGERGLKLRPERVKAHDERLLGELRWLENIFADMGFNPGSGQQVGYILAARGSILPLTKSHKQLQTHKDLLTELSDPLAGLILQWRGLAKQHSTYVEPCLNAARMYSHYRIDLATGRLASFDRNQQNLPHEIRDMFEADTGVWTAADASQIEMRVLAFISQDPAMLAAYESAGDIHADTQAALWPGTDLADTEIRARAKHWNFAKIYLAGLKTLSVKFGVPMEACRRLDGAWERRYPVAWAWLQHQAEMAEHVDAVPSIFGRLLRLPHDLPGARPDHVRKCAANYPVQNGAIEVIKRAMLRLERAGGYDFAVQVHDEIVFDGDVDIPGDLGDIVPGMPVPFSVSRGPDWH